MRRSSAGHLVTFVLFVAFAGGCATTQGLDTMSPSFLLRAAYISNVAPVRGTVYGPWNRALPTPRTELDPAKDRNAVFIMVFSSPEALTFRGTLKAPSGEVWRTFERKLDRLPAVTTTNPDWFRYATETFQTARMEHSPGLWSIDFFLNGALTGTYRFWLGDPETVVRLRKQGGAVAGVMPERSPAPGAAEPVRSLRSRAERGDGQAMAALGFMYFTGGGEVAKDDATAVGWFRKGAEAGSGSAMAFLGASYWVGLAGLPKDEAEAVRWFRKGVNAGDGRAMASLGQTYLTGGGGLARDEREAVRWFRQGAERDDGRAMAMLGQMYLTGGGGLARNDLAGVQWLRKAAASGDGFAMATLGGMYETGEGGLARDDAEAVRWYRMGAEAGSGRAMAQLGRMYSEGRGGLAKNPAEAVRWYRAGANLADALAMFALAQAQEAGLGVSKDRQQAIQWYRKSAGLGYPNAVDRLQNLDQ